MNRSELQRLAEDRVLDARALLAASRWSGAYYLAGYAVECGLKSCVLARIERTGVIFEDREFAKRCWTHDVETLVIAADLVDGRKFDIKANTDRELNWTHVKDWSETSRHQQKTEAQARRLLEAADDASNGVLPWIRTHW